MAQWLEHIAKHHREWVNIVKSWGEHEYHEDLVQEMYLKLHRYTTEERIIKNGEVNKGYVWYALRSVFVAYMNERNKLGKVSLDFDLCDENTNPEREEAFKRLFAKIEEEKDSWHWYDKLLHDTYYDKELSMRELADGSKISLTSIFNTLKNCKQRLNDNVREDYEDYLNEDYERI